MRKQLLPLAVGFAILCSNPTYSQLHLETPYSTLQSGEPQWVQLMYAEDANPDEVAAAYEAYYETNSFEKNQHTQYYKRWLHALSRDVDGVYNQQLRPDERAARAVKRDEFLQRSAALRNQRGGNPAWQGIGPFDFDKEAESRSYAAGAAHVYTVEQSASNPDVLYAGTATAGVWKSIDHGQNWTNLTAEMVLGTSTAIEINSLNPDVVYIEALAGIYRTSDGGITWDETGNGSFTSQSHNVTDIFMHPADTATLLATTSQGLWRTVNGGNTWTMVMSGDFLELEVHPTNDSIWYAVRENSNSTSFLKSTDAGNSFQTVGTGWPTPSGGEEQRRTEISVTAADPSKVYALCTGVANGGSGLYGIYVSDDEGLNWTFNCCGPQPAGVPDANTNMNLMGWADDGSDDGGQYYYDLAFDVSPTNADSLFVGGVNLWISGDGGQTFTCPSKWSHSDKVNYVHADIHDIRFYGNELWISCDGGVFFSDDNGEHFDRMQYGIQGTDFWGFGAGFWDGEVMLGGTYHNGTLLKNENVYINDWLSTDGGDNFRGFVNFGKEKVAYSDYDKKALVNDRTQQILTTGYSNKPHATYFLGESSELVFDPRCYNHWYSGVDKDLWKTEDDGASFELVHNFGNGNVREIEVAWSNPDRLYVVVIAGAIRRLWTTSDAGATWTEVTPSSATLGGNMQRGFAITVDHEDENTLWLARASSSTSNNFDGYQIFKTTDAGATWTNLTTPTLDGEFITNIEHQRGSDGGVWLGTRRAVYYRNNTMPDWELYNNNLPVNATSINLELNYRTETIRNGTSRSVHECAFYETSAPSAQIAVDKLDSYCLRDTMFFYDHSALSANQASWYWEFPGGSPATSTLRNPKVIYSASGTYSATLTVTDAYGTDTQTITDLFTITDGCSADSIPGFAMETYNGGDYGRIPSLDMQTNEITMSAWIKPNGTQDDYTGIVMSNGTAAGMNFRPGMELAYHWPGGAWSWSSGLIVPEDEWSHVVLVATPDSMRLYLNGVGATHVANLDTVDWRNETLMGSYKEWNSRNFFGEMDEVCIWNRAMNQDEVRDLRHLTKVPADDPTLLVYYQFNETEGPIMDRVGHRHAVLNGAAQRINSTTPVGGGKSYRTVMNSGTNHVFGTTGVSMTFPSGATLPEGEVVLTRLNVVPDEYPVNPAFASRSYWILNNYGQNAQFDAPTSIDFERCGDVSAADATDPSTFKMYLRPDNAFGSTWGAINGTGTAAVAGADGDVTIGQGLPSSVAGYQYVLTNEGGSSFQSTPSEVTELPVSDAFAIYPNPVGEGSQLTILSREQGPVSLEIYDGRGRLVTRQSFTGSLTLSVNEWESGVYLYRLQSQSKIQHGKVVR